MAPKRRHHDARQMEIDWDRPVVIPVAIVASPMPTKVIRKAYRFRMYPTKAQEQAMLKQAGTCRWVWNWALAQRKNYYAASGKLLTVSELSREFTKMKARSGFEWLADGVRSCVTQTLRDLHRGYNNFFAKRARIPKFKSRKRNSNAFRIQEDVRLEGCQVIVPKIGTVRVRGSRPIEGSTKSATFKQDALGRWHVTIVSGFEIPDVALPVFNSEHVVGIDLGLKNFAVLSTGEQIIAPKFFVVGHRKLRRAQRIMSRRKLGSNRRAKARTRVAKIHARIAAERSDFIHKFTRRIVNEFDAICIEDLSVKGLARTKLAKGVMDAAMGETRRQLTYKAEWNRRHLAIVDRWYPSSKTCYACKEVNSELTLKDRDWACPACGAMLDRDKNAACNIRDEGLRILAAGDAERLNARGARVRPAKVGSGRRSGNKSEKT